MFIYGSQKKLSGRKLNVAEVTQSEIGQSRSCRWFWSPSTICCGLMAGPLSGAWTLMQDGGLKKPKARPEGPTGPVFFPSSSRPYTIPTVCFSCHVLSSELLVPGTVPSPEPQ
ncbi:hypothetical protein KUCAC02_027871 [Chaenocephalus aceratus]|nr:hypothetical protein KUCAC02_027871 [Chaenocephalus aceratus]